MSLLNDISSFILIWDRKFFIDYWWRKKYNVSFGSEEHRKMNFIDMYIEYQETNIMNKKEINNINSSEIDFDYENLDLEKFDKK